MAFAVKSNNFKDGDHLGQAHILSADFGFGCAGGNQSPHLAWSGAPAGEELRRHLLTRRADWQRLLALAGREHPASVSEPHPESRRNGGWNRAMQLNTNVDLTWVCWSSDAIRREGWR
jgi:hypothetical protein